MMGENVPTNRVRRVSELLDALSMEDAPDRVNFYDTEVRFVWHMLEAEEADDAV